MGIRLKVKVKLRALKVRTRPFKSEGPKVRVVQLELCCSREETDLCGLYVSSEEILNQKRAVRVRERTCACNSR